MIFISILFTVVINPETTSASIPGWPPAIPPYSSYGARVVSLVVPPVATCIGIGYLIYTTRSLVPIYTTNPLKIPSIAGQFLGSISLMPSLTTCFTANGVPIPVSITTSNYGFSR